MRDGGTLPGLRDADEAESDHTPAAGPGTWPSAPRGVPRGHRTGSVEAFGAHRRRRPAVGPEFEAASRGEPGALPGPAREAALRAAAKAGRETTLPPAPEL